jgi:hypothetical protein
VTGRRRRRKRRRKRRRRRKRKRRRRRRRRKHLLYGLKEESECWELKEEALGSTLENSLWKWLCLCRKTDYILHEYPSTQPIYSTMFSSQLGCYSTV